nr:alpha/beta fold hydrolase [Pelotalea chapellei]
MPWCELAGGGRRIWYEEQGQGPVLVLLHGWCMSSAVWRLQADDLSSRFRVVMPDLAGHGRSELSTGYGFEAFAADLVQLFVQLDLRDVLLAGWSMGAQIVLTAYQQLRERLIALVLISGTPCFAATESFPYGLGLKDVEGMALKVRRSTQRALAGFTALMFTADELREPAVARVTADVLAAVQIPEAEVALQSLDALAETDLSHLLSTLDLPVLVINGDQDRICLPEASTYMAAHIPGSSHTVFSGSGHALFLVRSEKFNTCLENFWRRVSDRRCY